MTVTTRARHMDIETNATDVFEERGDFSRYLVFFWRWLPLLLGVALLGGAVAAIAAASRPTEYEATSTLAVSGSKMGEQAVSIAAADYRPFITNNFVAETVVKEFHLADAPYRLTPQAFLQSVLSVEEIRNSSLISLHVTLPDPRLAANIANRVSDLAVQAVRQLSQGEAVQARDDLRAAVDDARKQMQDASAKLEAFQNAAQVELTREDVRAMLEQRGQLDSLSVEIEAARARVARGEADLASTKRTDSFVRGIASDPLASQAAKSAGATDTTLLGLQLKSEEPSKVYQSIEEKLSEDRADLAAMERRRSQLVGALRLDAQQQSKLTALYRKEAELARLTADYEVAEKSYKDIAARYDVAKVQVASRSGQIQVIDQAIQPTIPQSRHVGRQGLFGFVAGGTLAALGLALTTALREALKRATAG